CNSFDYILVLYPPNAVFDIIFFLFSLLYLLLYSLYQFRGDTAYYCIRFHIFRHNRSSSHHSIVTDCHSWKNRRIRTYPDIPTQYNRCRIGSLAFFRRQTMIERCKDYIMPDLASVIDYHTTMVLKMTAGINKYAFAHCNILPEIGIERWEYPER